MIDESDEPPNESEPEGGQGGSPRGESGLTPSEENKLVGMVLNERLKRNDLVFPTTDRHDEVAVGVTARNMGSKDGRISNGAVSNYIKMKMLNQKEQHHREEMGREQGGVQVNVGISIGDPGERRDRVTVLTRRLGIGVDPQAPANGAANSHPHTNGHLPHSNGNGNGKAH